MQLRRDWMEAVSGLLIAGAVFDGALDQIATGKTIKRIEVNPSSAARGHLKVSSKLLQLAIIAGGASHGK